MLLSLALMNALSSTSVSSLAFADNLRSSSVSRFSPGKCSARSLRRARKTPLWASLAGDGTGGTKASASKLPITAIARRSPVFAGSPTLAPMAGGGIRAPKQQPGLGGALRIDKHLRVRADRENGGAPKARQVERSLHRVAAAAIGVKQGFALRRQLLVKSEYLSWPWRRTQHGDLFLQRLQSGKIDGIILEIDNRGT